MVKVGMGLALIEKEKPNKIGGTIMGATEITASKEINGEKKSATINYDFGENVDAAVSMFGGDVVHTQFVAAAKITAQGAMRRMLEQGKTQEEIEAKMNDWKPGVALSREAVDPLQAAIARFGTMSDEERNAFIQQLKERAGA